MQRTIQEFRDAVDRKRKLIDDLKRMAETNRQNLQNEELELEMMEASVKPIPHDSGD